MSATRPGGSREPGRCGGGRGWRRRAGVLGVVRAPVVGGQGGGAVSAAAHAAAAVAAPAPGPVRVEADGGRVGVQLVAVTAGAVGGADLLGVFPRLPVDDRGVDRSGGPQPLVLGDGAAAAVAGADPAVDHVPGVLRVAQDDGDGLGGPAGGAGGGGVPGGVEPGGDGGHSQLVHDTPGEDLRDDGGAYRVQDEPGFGAALASPAAVMPAGVSQHQARPGPSRPVAAYPARRHRARP